MIQKDIPYGQQQIDEQDIAAVVEVLRSPWLTTGPKVAEFEDKLCHYVAADHGVAVNSGTAALHTSLAAIGIKPGDEVIVPAITFVATANAVIYCGGKPVFSDVLPDTLLIDPEQVRKKISSKTKAILAVDYAGQPCDYYKLQEISEEFGLYLIADSCHALGAGYDGKPVGSIADITVFSFHPVKHITTGEGGMAVTNNPVIAERMRAFRNHGMVTDHHARRKNGTWHYEIHELGFNYRMSDIQCALGISQLDKATQWVRRRQEIAAVYDAGFSALPGVSPLTVGPNIEHAYHLYVLTIDKEKPAAKRADLFKGLAKRGIRAAVHYFPVHLQPLYQRRYQTNRGDCPVAEQMYEKIISLPMFPGLSSADIEKVTEAVSDLMVNKL